jgi:hypothetical protein
MSVIGELPSRGTARHTAMWSGWSEARRHARGSPTSAAARARRRRLARDLVGWLACWLVCLFGGVFTELADQGQRPL